MNALKIGKTLHHADKRVMEEYEAEIAKKVFQFAEKTKNYKKEFFQSEVNKEIDWSDRTEAQKKHLLGELRCAGDYVTRYGWKQGLTFGAACKVSRGSHSIKKDIDKGVRDLHRTAMSMLEGAKGKGTWAAQTAYLNNEEEGKQALEQAKQIIEAAKE